MNLALRVCLVLEVLSMNAEFWTPEERLRMASNVYRWCHCATSPDCLKNHPEWLPDFEQTEAGLIEARQIPDWRQGVPA